MTKQRKKAAAIPAVTLGGEVVLYKPAGGQVQMDVRLDRDTVWLSLNQMAELFGRDKSVVSRHLLNIFKTKELHRSSTVAKNATVQSEGGREVIRDIEYFNLDAILSVGYRVNSKQGTQFRIWATRTLREHLLQGYTLSEKRLRERGFGELEQAVELLSNTLRNQSLVTGQGRDVLDVLDVLDVVQKYTRARTDLRRRTAVPDGTGACCPPAVLRHQGPSLLRRQQAHRHAAVPGISAA